MSRTVRLGAVTAALLAYVGCAVSTEPSDVDGLGTGSEVLAPVERTDDPSWAREARDVTTVGAKLRSSFARTARETVCVSYDGDLDVVAIDEFECRAIRDPNGGGWKQMCASCIMDFRDARDGSLFLVAQPEGQCQLFAGTYLVSPNATAAACGPVPQTYILKEGCELGGNAKPECLVDPPAYPREHAKPY